MSSIVNLSAVVLGPMSESYTIMRSTGMFVKGGWVMTSSPVGGYGVVSVATTEDLEMIPEMDRVTGSMVFHSYDRIYLTELDDSSTVSGSQGYGVDPWGSSPSGGITSAAQRVSDIIIWNNVSWRVIHVGPYPNHGFWKAIAVRLPGN